MASRWKALLGMVLVLTAVSLPANAQGATPEEIEQAVQTGGQWLTSKQAASGAISGFNGDWATTSLASAGFNAADLKGEVATLSLQDYWQAQYSDPEWGELPNTSGVGAISKAVLIAHSAGLQPSRISPSVNLAASLASTYSWETGMFGTSAAPNVLGFALLALPHLGFPEPIAEPLVESLLSNQHEDGGWAFYAGNLTATGDTDMTGAVLAMICSNGMSRDDRAVEDGLAFLKSYQDESTGAIGASGPWVPPFNGPTHGWALIGIQACGEDPQGEEWSTESGMNPIEAALSLRLPSGAFGYVPGAVEGNANNVSSTEALVRALAGDLFSADPPERTDPTLARQRPVPEVAVGTEVPIALSIDDRDGPVRLCAVVAPTGASLSDVLQRAEATSVPAGCVDELVVENGSVHSVNGATSVDPRGGWVASISGSGESRAGAQRVGFGDVAVLRLEHGPLSVEPDTDPKPDPDPDTGGQPVGEPGNDVRGGSAGSRPRFRVVKGFRVPGRGRSAVVASVICPASSSGCSLAAPGKARIRFRSGPKSARVVPVRLAFPRRIAAGDRGKIKVTVSRRVARRLRGARASGRVRFRFQAEGRTVKRTVSIRLGRGRGA